MKKKRGHDTFFLDKYVGGHGVREKNLKPFQGVDMVKHRSRGGGGRGPIRAHFRKTMGNIDFETSN